MMSITICMNIVSIFIFSARFECSHLFIVWNYVSVCPQSHLKTLG